MANQLERSPYEEKFDPETYNDDVISANTATRLFFESKLHDIFSQSKLKITARDLCALVL